MEGDLLAIAMKTVLLVEDIDAYRMEVCYALGHSGFTVYEAATGSEALRYVADIPHVDIALLNLQLPDTNGLELAAILKAKYGEGMHVLFVSAPEKPEMELLRTTAPASDIVSRVRSRFPALDAGIAASARG